eukprot:COSAG02_NODE_1982_length_10196_cov_6.214816_2_plen_54_part_00
MFPCGQLVIDDFLSSEELVTWQEHVDDAVVSCPHLQDTQIMLTTTTAHVWSNW